MQQMDPPPRDGWLANTNKCIPKMAVHHTKNHAEASCNVGSCTSSSRTKERGCALPEDNSPHRACESKQDIPRHPRHHGTGVGRDIGLNDARYTIVALRDLSGPSTMCFSYFFDQVVAH